MLRLTSGMSTGRCRRTRGRSPHVLRTAPQAAPQRPCSERRMDDAEVRELVARVEGLLGDLDVRGTKAVQALVELYGEALARFVAGADPVEDELLSHLLLVHDLHPVDVETRVRRAIDDVRPYL